MMDMSSPGVLIALGALAIVLLVLLAILLRSKPKRAEKWEKAAIMKQLLALSEREENLRRAAPGARPAPTPRPLPRPATANLKASSKTTLPPRLKTTNAAKAR